MINPATSSTSDRSETSDDDEEDIPPPPPPPRGEHTRSIYTRSLLIEKPQSIIPQT